MHPGAVAHLLRQLPPTQQTKLSTWAGAQGCVRATVSLADSPSKSSNHAALSSSADTVYSTRSHCSSPAQAAHLHSPFSAACTPPPSTAAAWDDEDVWSQRSCSGRHYSRCGAERPRPQAADSWRSGCDGDTWSQASRSRRQDGSCGAERVSARDGEHRRPDTDEDAWSEVSCSSRRHGRHDGERPRARHGDPWRAGNGDDVWSQPSCSGRRHGRCGAEGPRSRRMTPLAQNDTTRRATCWETVPGASESSGSGSGGGRGGGEAAAQRMPPRPSCDYTRLQVLRKALHRASQEGRSPGCGARTN